MASGTVGDGVEGNNRKHMRAGDCLPITFPCRYHAWINTDSRETSEQARTVGHPHKTAHSWVLSLLNPT